MLAGVYPDFDGEVSQGWGCLRADAAIYASKASHLSSKPRTRRGQVSASLPDNGGPPDWDSRDPHRCTARLPASMPKAVACDKDLPRARLTVRPARKASPAPLASTTSTLGAGTVSVP